MADETPAEPQEAQPVEPQGAKTQQQMVAAQSVQVLQARAQAPKMIPKSYDELFMSKISRFFDFWEKYGWLYEYNPWVRKMVRSLGEMDLQYIRALHRDPQIGDRIWGSYTAYRDLHKDEKDFGLYLANTIFHELTVLEKTGQQSSLGVDRTASWKLEARFDQMFGDPNNPQPDDEIGLRELIAMMKQDVEDDYDVLVFICNREQDRHGGKGSGKSDFAQVLAAMLDPHFDTRHDTVYVDDHVRFGSSATEGHPGTGLMGSTTRRKAWVIDELDKWVNKQETMAAPVRKVASDFIDRRFLNQFVIGCDPQLWYASTKFLNNVTYIIRIVRRGVAEVFLGNDRDEGAKKILAPQLGGDGHLIEFPRMSKPWREVYDRCKLYAKSHGPGALDKMLKLHARWPFSSPVAATGGSVESTEAAALKSLLAESPLLSGPVGSAGVVEDVSGNRAP